MIMHMPAAATLTLEPPALRPATGVARSLGSPSVVLFLALFASQAGVLVLSPILADVAREFDVSISTAGQLRILAAPLAAIVAVAVARSLGRFQARSLLALGVSLLGAGSLASAAAPTFSALALAQIPLWAGVAILISAGVSATASWSVPGERARVVAHALAGPPAAWIVGMPLIGLAAEVNWRLAFLVLPLPAAVLAGLALVARAPDRDSGERAAQAPLTALLRKPRVRQWAIGELLANSAWAGTLVFSGALLTEVHGTSSLVTGIGLALVAAAYLLGNVWSGRLDPRRARRSMLETTAAAGAAVGLVWAVTPDVVTTLVLFSVAGFVAAARTVSGTVYGFDVSRGQESSVGVIRAATTQIGYLLGSLAGGVALAIGGFDALALAYGGLFLAALTPYICMRRECRLRGALLAAEA
jgi:DHA1 family inner membrane transport protein